MLVMFGQGKKKRRVSSAFNLYQNVQIFMLSLRDRERERERETLNYKFVNEMVISSIIRNVQTHNVIFEFPCITSL